MKRAWVLLFALTACSPTVEITPDEAVVFQSVDVCTLLQPGDVNGLDFTNPPKRGDKSCTYVYGVGDDQLTFVVSQRSGQYGKVQSREMLVQERGNQAIVLEVRQVPAKPGEERPKIGKLIDDTAARIRERLPVTK